MKFVKKGIALLLIIVVGIGLTGCRNSDSVNESGSAEDEIELTLWILNNRIRGIEEVIGNFEEANPGITIDLVNFDVDGILQNLRISATSDTLPDLWFNWGGERAEFYTRNGLTYDLSDFAVANNWDEKFEESALGLAELAGQIAGYPIVMNGMSIYYRIDIFEELGLEVPTTLEEFEEVATVLRDNGTIPFAMGGGGESHLSRLAGFLLEYYGGAENHDSLQSLETYWEDNEVVIQALTKFQEWDDNDFFPEGYLTMDGSELGILFYTGQAAMMIDGQWADRTIIEDEQDLNLYGTFPFGGTIRQPSYIEMIQFNANLSDEEVEAAVKFLNYLLSENNIRAYSGLVPSPRKDVDYLPEEQINVPHIVEAMQKNGVFLPIDQALPATVSDAISVTLQGVAGGNLTPEEGASAIQRAIEQYQADE